MNTNVDQRKQAGNARLHRLIAGFRYREFRRYWTGSVLTQMTFRMQEVVLGWQVLALTGSATWVGLVSFAYGAAMLGWSPLTGFWADRLRRQWILVTSMALAASTVAVLALLTTADAVLPWHILVASFLLGGTFSLYAPARLALLPSLVPGAILLSASTVEYSSTRLMGFVGPMVAGTLVDKAGIATALLAQVATFAGAGLVFLRTGTEADLAPPRDVAQPTGFLRGWREVTDYVRCDRPMIGLFILSLVIVPFGMTYQRLLAVVVHDIYGEGAATLGLMVGISSFGAAVVGFALASAGDVFSKGRALWLTAILSGAGLVVFAFTRQVALALVVLFALGLLNGVYLTLSNLLFQSRPPDRLRGRVMGAYAMVWGIAPFAHLVAGAVADRIGVMETIAASGVICIVFCGAMTIGNYDLCRL